jgi:sodium transport system permease protein
VYHHPARRPGAASAFTPVGGVVVLLAGWASFIVAVSAMGTVGAPALAGLALGEIVLLTVPVVAAWRAGVGPSLGLRGAAAIYFASAVLVGCALWFLNWQAVVAIDVPKERVSVLAKTLETPPLVVALLAMAVLPAVCEEIMFRGVVLRAFAGAWPPWAAVAASAALFSAYHINLPQALPTFTLGLALGALALRSGSVYPTMIAHFVNNVFPVLVTRDEIPELSDWLTDNTVYATVGASTLVIVGVACMFFQPRGDDVVAHTVYRRPGVKDP